MSTPLIPRWTTGDRLRKAREAAGLERTELAVRLGIHRNSIRNYEIGRSGPNRWLVKAWAEETDVPLWWLLDDEVTDDGGGVASPFPIEYPWVASVRNRLLVAA